MWILVGTDWDLHACADSEISRAFREILDMPNKGPLSRSLVFDLWIYFSSVFRTFHELAEMCTIMYDAWIHLLV